MLSNLPPNLGINNEQTLLELLHVILSTKYVIDNISLDTTIPQQIPEDILSILGLDIQSEILLNIHPYYMKAYCLTNTTQRQFCDNNIYRLFRKWCINPASLQESKFTVKELSELYPKLTFNDVVEIALLRHPIPESVNYWDRVSLYYYARLNKQENAGNYILPLMDILSIPDNPRRSAYGAWIAYKFTDFGTLSLGKEHGNLYVDIINKILLHKYGKESALHGNSFTIYRNFTTYFILDLPRLCGTILTYEDIVEIIIICRVIYYEDVLYNVLLNGHWINNYMGRLDNESLASIMIMYSAINCGADRVNELLAKYKLDDKVDTGRYPNFDINLITNSVIIKLRMRTEPELVESQIARLARETYYLTQGNILEALKYKHEDIYGAYQTPIIPASMYGISDSGLPIFNVTMQPNVINGDNMVANYHRIYEAIDK